MPLQSVLQLLLMVQNTFTMKHDKILLLILQPFHNCKAISKKISAVKIITFINTHAGGIQCNMATTAQCLMLLYV